MLLTDWEVETSQVNYCKAALEQTALSKYYFDLKLGSKNSLTGVAFFPPFFSLKKKQQRRGFLFSPLFPHSGARREAVSDLHLINLRGVTDLIHELIFFSNDSIICIVTFFKTKMCFCRQLRSPCSCSCWLERTPLSTAAQIRLL